MKIGNLNVEIRRKAIKNLHISVLPPSGAVRVSAPLNTSFARTPSQRPFYGAYGQLSPKLAKHQTTA
nr:hypothetical protein [Neisseria meningitidis]